MKTSKKLNPLALAAFAPLFAASPAALAAFDLTGIGYVQYGDAQSYSLPIAQLQNGCTGPGCTFFVASSPGQINDLTVLGTGSSGTPILQNFTGMDYAYSTPSGVNGSTYWNPSPTTSNGTLGVVNNNGANTWDTSLAALKTYLNSEQMIFFFNNNQVNSLGTAAQSLAAWAQVTVKDAGGAIIGIYDFTNSNTFGAHGAYDLVSQGGGGTFMGNVGSYTHAGGVTNPFAGTQQSTDYVLSGGSICVTTNTAIPIPVPCDPANSNISAPINHNLGANEAAYAILFPELNAQLNALFSSLTDAQLATYTMSVDVRLGCDPSLSDAALVCTGQDSPSLLYGRNLNNGYEQLFISTATNVINIPEPGTLALVGFALLGLAASRRRRSIH